MRTKAEAPGIKRGLLLHESAAKRIDCLRQATEAGSDSDVIRNALIYYAQLVDDVREGYRMIIRSEGHQDTAVPIVSRDELRAAGGSLVKRNLVLHERSARRLDALKEATQATSDSEVVRDALMVYALLVESAQAGKRLILSKGTGEERELLMPVSAPENISRRPLNILNHFVFG